MDVPLSVRFTATERRERSAACRPPIDSDLWSEADRNGRNLSGPIAAEGSSTLRSRSHQMLHLRTFRECESVLYIDAQIANGALDLREAVRRRSASGPHAEPSRLIN